MYLDGLKIEFETANRSITETIACAKKKKQKITLQALKNCCEQELQGRSCHAFTAPFSDHPLFDHIVFLIELLQSQKASYRKILYSLRKALGHPAYLRDRHKQNHPFIHFLHTLCLASYAVPPLLAPYQQIG